MSLSVRPSGRTKFILTKGPLTGTLSLLCCLSHLKKASLTSLLSDFRNRFILDPFCTNRANNFGCVFTNILDCRIYEPRSRHKFASFFPYYVSHVILTFPLALKTFLLCVTEPGCHSTSLPIYYSGRKVEGNFTHKVNYRWDIRSSSVKHSEKCR